MNVKQDALIGVYQAAGEAEHEIWRAALKSDLGSYFKNTDLSEYTSDCNACTKILSFIDEHSQNTPFKQLNVGAKEGLLISVKPFISGVYNCQYVLTLGDIQGKHIWTRYKTSTSDWTTWSAVA